MTTASAPPAIMRRATWIGSTPSPTILPITGRGVRPGDGGDHPHVEIVGFLRIPLHFLGIFFGWCGIEAFRGVKGKITAIIDGFGVLYMPARPGLLPEPFGITKSFGDKGRRLTADTLFYHGRSVRRRPGGDDKRIFQDNVFDFYFQVRHRLENPFRIFY